MTSDSPVSAPASDVLCLTALQWGLAPLSPWLFALPRDAATDAARSGAAAAEPAADTRPAESV